MNTGKPIPCRTYNCVVRLEKKTFWPSLLVVVGVFGFGLYFSAVWYWLVILCLPFLMAGVAVLWWPVIEPVNGILRERALVFGRILLAERITPLNECVEIFYEWGVGSGDRSGDFCLFLRHKTGRKYRVMGSWSIRRSVEETAWQISCDTGIKLKGEPNPK
ncbi:MAG: hypothetical protein MUF81_01780 [Verrucomicrobia bacterium]|jgi:hypothetical protein|nr:hypothetical protein [Verrucomicrobiota bacterium]